MTVKRTKIIATIGPSSRTLPVLTEMIKAGLDVARLNFSHGSLASHAKLVKMIRKAGEKVGQPVAIMQDLQGPRIRLGKLPKQGIVLKEGEIISFGNGRASKKHLPVDFQSFKKIVKVGQRVLVADGCYELIVKQIKQGKVFAQVKRGGVVYSHKGINLPDSKLVGPVITTKDKKDLAFGIKNGVDYIALSFVRTAEDVRTLKRMIKRLKGKAGVVAKIERPEAIKHIKEIVMEADAVMIARGDLGIELSAEQVPILQKKIIGLCL
ncbi:MAG: pyruvate kinase, partial [bacterium]